MAVTKNHPGIRVEVRVGGVALQEYDDDDEQLSESAITKYIEATSGATFDLRFEITPKWPVASVMFHIYLDGQCIRGLLMQQTTYRGAKSELVIDGSFHTKDNQWFKSKFAFSALKIDDSDIRSAGDKLMKDMKEMGEIKVEGFFVKNIRKSKDNKLSASHTSELGNIPEKALKGRALSHQATLCAPKVSHQSSVLSYDHMDPSGQPFITFKFKHRSKAALQSLLIIPRSPSPVPLEDRDVDTLTPEESRQLIQRLRERNQTAPAIKREGVKRERSHTMAAVEDYGDEVSFVSAKRRRPPVTLDENGVEIVDLT